MCSPAEIAQRAAVVSEARRWVGTPYRHRGATLGECCDCANILIETFVAAGLIDRFAPGDYAPDWHLHRDEERYLAVVERYCARIDDGDRQLVERGSDFRAAPGDILMWRWGRTFSHSAIVTAWPNIVHAFAPERFVVECDVTGTPMSDKPMRVYSFWER
jgi:NlpC/P60 family putative phage cell wall peptidase